MPALYDFGNSFLNAYNNERKRIQELQRYNDAIAYRNQRDRILDDRYNDTIEYRKARDIISDSRYNTDIAYKKERDIISDKRYNADIAYRNQRDIISDDRYNANIAYRNQRNTILDDRYNADIAYKKERDKISDDRYDDNKEYRDKMFTFMQDKQDYYEDITNRNYTLDSTKVNTSKKALESNIIKNQIELESNEIPDPTLPPLPYDNYSLLDYLGGKGDYGDLFRLIFGIDSPEDKIRTDAYYTAMQNEINRRMNIFIKENPNADGYQREAMQAAIRNNVYNQYRSRGLK